MFSGGPCRSAALAASVGNSWHFEEFFETEIVRVRDDAPRAQTMNGNCGSVPAAGALCRSAGLFGGISRSAARNLAQET